MNFQVSTVLKKSFIANQLDVNDSSKKRPECCDELCTLVSNVTKISRSEVLYAHNKDAALEGNIVLLNDVCVVLILVTRLI